MATINTQFSVGDTVYMVATRRELAPVTCAACGSTGSITLSGQEFRCPACGGRQTKGDPAQVVIPFVVTSVRAVDRDGGCDISYEGQSVGIVPESSLFATEAAALASIGG